MKKYILVLSLIFFVGTLKATVKPVGSVLADTAKRKTKAQTIFPVVPANISRLFYIQRDPNPNTIVYELNLDRNGQPDEDQPVHPYWIRYRDGGAHEELNYIQRKFAYGLNQKYLGNGKWDIRFVSYKKFLLTLTRSNDGKFHIYTTIAQKQAILNRIFVRIEGGSFWIPNVVYVEVKGTDPATGQEIADRFKP